MVCVLEDYCFIYIDGCVCFVLIVFCMLGYVVCEDYLLIFNIGCVCDYWYIMMCIGKLVMLVSYILEFFIDLYL